ncbi:MAG: magnesium transporter [Candidatus Heimdallarchaeaceae archaeon]
MPRRFPKRQSLLKEYSALAISAFGAIVFNIGGIFAGRTAVLLNKIQPFLPWIFLIFPLLLTVRGDISGILTGNLGTSLHLGTIKPSFRQNTKRFYELLSLILMLSFYDSVFVTIISTLICLIMKISMEFLSILVITITTFFIGTVISLFLTVVFSFFVFNHNGDPDVYTYPIMSTVNDIIITIVFFLTCIFYRPWKTKLSLYAGLPLVSFIFLLIMFLQVYWIKNGFIKLGLKQSLPPLLVTTIIAAGTGSLLVTFENLLQAVPIVLVVLPSVLSTVGAQNSIIANTTTTKLHLGTLEPKISFIKSKELLLPFCAFGTVGILMSIIYSLLAVAIYPINISLILYFSLLLVLISSNLISYLIVSSLAFLTAVLTYKYGFNPDNIVIPVLSTLADLISTSFLVLFSILIIL